MQKSIKPTVIFVTTNHYQPLGGSEVLWSRSAAYLASTGNKVGVCALHWKPLPRHLSQLANQRCELHLIPAQGQSFFHKAIRASAKKLGFSRVKKFGSWLRKCEPDLVVFSMGNSTEGFPLINECRNLGLPYALCIQLVSEHSWLEDEKTSEMIDIYRNATACFFVSEGNRELVERMTGVVLENAEIIENPYTVSFQQPFAWPDFDGVYRFACVANLHSLHKGQDLLFKALSSDKWKHRPVEFNLFGDGPHREILQRLKSMWNLNQVNFRGFVEDISEVWKDHHALVMPSRMEGMPLALQEAMLSGRVPVVTRVGGNAELVQDGINGFVAAAPTVELFDEALDRAWARRDDWKAIGAAAYQYAHQHISSDPVQDFANRLLAINLADS